MQIRRKSIEGEESKPLKSFEEVFDRTTHYGRYQLFMLLCIQYMMINAAGNYVFVSFASLRPSCQHTVPDTDICTSISSCNASTSVFLSLYEDADFVCPHSELPQHLQSLQAIGSGVGALLGGHLADYFGRKWITYVGALQVLLFGLAGGVAPNWQVLAAAMLGMGFAYGVLIDSSMTLASETVGGKYRIVQTLAFQWSIAIQVAAVCAYLTASWRSYLVWTNLICVPVLFIMPWAAEALNHMAKYNRCSARFTPEDLHQLQLDGSAHNKIFSVWDLFSSWQLFAYSIVMILSALTVETTVAVIIFDVQTFAGNPFVNIALYGVLRLWVPAFVVLMDTHSSWFGRRALFIGSQTITCICFSLYLILPSIMPLATSLRTTLALTAGIVNSSIFFTVYKQYSIELYPTLMRATAVGTFGVVERMGGALAPQLVTMNHTVWKGSAITFATVLIVVSLIAGAIILPETKNNEMPDVSTPQRREQKVVKEEDCEK